jgi:hypothetical protein
MHFGTKSYLKSTRNHTVKHALTTTGGPKKIMNYAKIKHVFVNILSLEHEL